MILFDPLSIIIKLGILSKKPIGTKLSSQNFIVEIQEAGFFQSIYRYLNNDSSYDLKYLVEPIIIACQYYLNIDKIEINPNIKKIFIYALDGIENLSKIYKKNLIIYYNLKFIELIILSYIKIIDSKFEYNSLTKSLSQNSLINNDNKILIKSSSSINVLNGEPSKMTQIMNPVLIRYGSTGFFMFEESDFYLDSPSECSYNMDIDDTYSRDISDETSYKNVNLNNDLYSPSLSNSPNLTFKKNYSNNNFKSISSLHSSPSLKCTSRKNSLQLLQNNNSINNYNIDFIKNCIENNYPNILLTNFDKYWTNEKITNIIIMFDFYFNSQLKIYKNEIEHFMKNVDNDIVNIILDYYIDNTILLKN